MTTETVQTHLQERFAAPLREFYTRRIIFWQDPDGECEELVDTLHLDGVTVVKLTGQNNFAVKRQLLETDPDGNYLVYNPIVYADVRDNWLLDVELYSEEFRADLLSMRMAQLDMPLSAEARRAVKQYARFFDNKERTAKLTAFHSDYQTVAQLHVDVLAVLCGTTDNTLGGVVRALLTSSSTTDDHTALMQIRKFGDEDMLWQLLADRLGYERREGESLIALAAHLLFNTLAVTMKPEAFNILSYPTDAGHRAACFEIVDDWMRADDVRTLYALARDVEAAWHLPERFAAMDVADLLGSECFPCIDECIVRHYMREVAEQVIKADEITATVEQRRTARWYTPVRRYYEGLLQIADMQRFYLEHIGGFHVAEHVVMWERYTADYYRMDSCYRAFYTAFSASLHTCHTDLDDLFKTAAEYAERLYKQWFLSELSGHWTSLIKDELGTDARLSRVPQQQDFFKRFVAPGISGTSRTYVIVSDALRYEVAAELTAELTRDTHGQAELTAMQSVIPSVTKTGMAALLPHRDMTLDAEGRVLCDGMSTVGTAQREKVLKRTVEDSVALTYASFVSMKKAERRETVNGKKAVYIYHNTIDAVAETAATEDKVFEACTTAVSEIKNLVRIITNELGGATAFITADHGFLYTYEPLAESEKIEKTVVRGDILELDRRYVIAAPDSVAEHMIRVSAAHLHSDNCLFMPLDTIRIRKQGGNNRYIHGGLSLQELCVPVIAFKNKRVTSKNYVETQKAPLRLVSQSRKISNRVFSLDFYQAEAVGGKTAAATYLVYITDAVGNLVSDQQTVIADKSGESDAQRLFRVRLTLKNTLFRPTDVYYLTIAEQSAPDEGQRIEFAVDVATDDWF